MDVSLPDVSEKVVPPSDILAQDVSPPAFLDHLATLAIISDTWRLLAIIGDYSDSERYLAILSD